MMTKFNTNELVRISAALIAGFIGGQIHSGSAPVAAASNVPLRASRFDLTDNTGRTLAYWGSESGQNPCLHFLDSRGAEVVAMGLQWRDSPFLNMMSSDSKIRATLRLEGADRKPILAMSDEKWEGRVMLGFMQPDFPTPTWDQWGLVFRAPQGDTRIASFAMTRGISGHVSAKLVVLDQNGRLWDLPREPQMASPTTSKDEVRHTPPE